MSYTYVFGQGLWQFLLFCGMLSDSTHTKLKVESTKLQVG